MSLTSKTIRFGVGGIREQAEDAKEVKIGFELELTFNPTTLQLASMGRFLPEMDIEAARKFLTKEIAKNMPLIHQAVEDSGDDEFISRPITLKALQIVGGQVKDLLSTLKVLGFQPTQSTRQRSGLHISIDRANVSVETLEKVIDFLFSNHIWFLALSGRQNSATREADLNYLLGNHFNHWDKNTVYERYQQYKNELKHSYINKTFAQILNIRVYKDDKPYIHFGHFAATTDYIQFMGCCEFMFALFEFFKDNETKEINEFVAYVTNSGRYPHLVDYFPTINEQVVEFNAQLSSISSPPRLLLDL